MTTPLIERSDICAVVVTYFPKPGCAENMAALAPQVGELVIVDNGSSAQSLEPVQAAAQRLAATVVRLGSNLGIAAALNVGLRFAREHGYPWLATFDQDSQATPSMVAEMIAALDSYPQSERVAVLAPVHADRATGLNVLHRGDKETGSKWRVIRSTMTSGNLVNIEAASAVGGFDDSLFIDYVDHEFCLRLRRHGYRILEATGAELLHSLGQMEVRRFGTKRVVFSNHPVNRRYYITRNRVIVWREYWRLEPGWILHDMRTFLLESACIVLFERQAGAKLWMILRGVCDALRNVRGALSPRP